jgi:hypothetical protein
VLAVIWFVCIRRRVVVVHTSCTSTDWFDCKPDPVVASNTAFVGALSDETRCSDEAQARGSAAVGLTHSIVPIIFYSFAHSPTRVVVLMNVLQPGDGPPVEGRRRRRRRRTNEHVQRQFELVWAHNAMMWLQPHTRGTYYISRGQPDSRGRVARDLHEGQPRRRPAPASLLPAQSPSKSKEFLSSSFFLFFPSPFSLSLIYFLM